MERWSGKIAVVTGASAGIGAAIAEELVRHGCHVVGLARRKEKLMDLQRKVQGLKGELYPLQADIAKTEEIIAAFKWVKDNLKTVHILVNNAGFSKFGKLVEQKPEVWKAILNVNVLGLCTCTQEAFKLMKETDVSDGHIIHINSILGHVVPNMGDPVFNIYPASKHAVTALTETLRLELLHMKSNIKITQISPGYVETEFVSVATKESGIKKDFASMLKQMKGLQPQDLADAVVYALSTPSRVHVHDIVLKPMHSPH